MAGLPWLAKPTHCSAPHHPNNPCSLDLLSPAPLSCSQAVQRSERELAGADSRFFKIDGIELHYKRCSPVKPGISPASTGTWAPSGGLGGTVDGGAAAAGQQGGGAARPPIAVHCLHGFGASCYRWARGFGGCSQVLQLGLGECLGRTASCGLASRVCTAEVLPHQALDSISCSAAAALSQSLPAAGALCSRSWRTHWALWSQRTTCRASA